MSIILLILMESLCMKVISDFCFIKVNITITT